MCDCTCTSTVRGLRRFFFSDVVKPLGLFGGIAVGVYLGKLRLSSLLYQPRTISLLLSLGVSNNGGRDVYERQKRTSFLLLFLFCVKSPQLHPDKARLRHYPELRHTHMRERGRKDQLLCVLWGQKTGFLVVVDIVEVFSALPAKQKNTLL